MPPANPNAFIDLNKAKKEDYVAATQTVYHDAGHPSFIELPVIPSSHKPNWIEPEDFPFSSSISGFDYALNAMDPSGGTEIEERNRADLPSTTPPR